ncbi:hypothetical protein MTP10_21660 [Nonomuraea sp. 3-1Str]|nr:hypothetical protein [Nonomuraea sp. 3-1Str]MDR8411327.1 hypothetical protein [Nonomuraea sp. 3-1Str]
MAVGDQGIHQRGTGLPIVPGDAWLARIAVVMGGATVGGGLRGAGPVADHPPDGGDQ